MNKMFDILESFLTCSFSFPRKKLSTGISYVYLMYWLIYCAWVLLCFCSMYFGTDLWLHFHICCFKVSKKRFGSPKPGNSTFHFVKKEKQFYKVLLGVWQIIFLSLWCNKWKVLLTSAYLFSLAQTEAYQRRRLGWFPHWNSTFCTSTVGVALRQR